MKGKRGLSLKSDVVRDAMFKGVAVKLNEKHLHEKDDIFVDALVGKLKRNAKRIIKESRGKNIDQYAVTVEKVANSKESEPPTRKDKEEFLRIWFRTLVPVENYMWVTSYSHVYHQCILKLLLGEEYPGDNFPEQGRGTMHFSIQQWYRETHLEQGTKVEEKKEEEDVAVEPPAKTRKTPQGKKVKPAAEKQSDKQKETKKDEEEKPQEKKDEKVQENPVKEDKAALPAAVAEVSSNDVVPPSLPSAQSDAAMVEPAPSVPPHLHSLSGISDPVPSTPATPAPEPAPAPAAAAEPAAPSTPVVSMELVRGISQSLREGESQVITLDQLVSDHDSTPEYVIAAVKVMQDYGEAILDESVGVVYSV